MRDAQSTQDFERIDRKLAEIEAPGDLPLGVAPLLLRIAVLHRWRLAEPDPAQREQLRRQETDVFEAACRSVENLRRSGRSPRYRGTMTAFGPLHGALFNQLELACYFTGADYELIDGLRADSNVDIDLCEGLPERADWLVLGRGLGREYRLPKSVALAEQRDLAAKSSTQLAWSCPMRRRRSPRKSAFHLISRSCLSNVARLGSQDCLRCWPSGTQSATTRLID